MCRLPYLLYLQNNLQYVSEYDWNLISDPYLADSDTSDDDAECSDNAEPHVSTFVIFS